MGRGDVSAVGELYGIYKNPIFAYALSLLKSRAAAEDAVSETFLRFYRYSSNGKEISNIKALLFTICRNAAFDLIKASRLETLPPDDHMEAPMSDTDGRLVVQEAMNRLEEGEREIVTLYCVTGMKHKEIAEITQQPEGTVRWKYRLALGKLRRELGGNENG